MTDFTLEGLDHVAITVSDIDRSIAWYQDKLGLERIQVDSWAGVPTFMVSGSGGLALFPEDKDQSRSGGEACPPAVRHIAFRATRQDFEAAQSSLAAHGVSFTFQDHEIAHSIYFSDPDGYQLEITTYEV
ncbi:MAG: VOC family protein [candidate division Zixibacteria bacterium]|nr:VOC family protein [candidate division Zixibacteria bacterium]